MFFFIRQCLNKICLMHTALAFDTAVAYILNTTVSVAILFNLTCKPQDNKAETQQETGRSGVRVSLFGWKPGRTKSSKKWLPQ
jgi:hypothetical protein